ALAVGPDGRMLASASQDGLLRLWDAQSGKVVQEFAIPLDERDPSEADKRLNLKMRRGIRFSQDGRLLAWWREDGLAVAWDLTTGQERCHFHTPRVLDRYGSEFAIGFRGNRLLAAGANALRDDDKKNFGSWTWVWGVTTGEQLLEIPPQEAFITALAF